MPRHQKQSPRGTLAPLAAVARSGEERPTPSPHGRWWPVAMVGLLVVAVWGVYGRALRAPFTFEDQSTVVNNPSIRQLWPLVGDAQRPGPLNGPQDFCTAGRPLVNLSLAVNYHFGELNSFGYHVVNLSIHTLTTLLVWAIVRRTLRQDYFHGQLVRAAGPLALAVALVWAVHPLQTEAVEYVTQRTELLVSFFYLSTLLASLHYWDARSAGMRGAWLGVATAACLCGMASKEVMVSAPLVVLLYDRTFVAGSFRRALRDSWPLYAGLALSWALLAALNIHGPRSASAGFHLGVPVYVWWFTQAKVLAMYLRLAFWPAPLVIHYEMPLLDTFAAAWPWAAMEALLAIVTLALLWRRTAAGFLAASFFLILGPTFLVPILSEVAAERRMYLPLAALAALLLVGGYRVLAWAAEHFSRDTIAAPRPPWPGIMAGAIVATLAIVLALASVRRLTFYEDPFAMWQDAAIHQPDNAVVHNNLGVLLRSQDRIDEAIAEYRRALQIRPDFVEAHLNLAVVLRNAGQLEEAIEHYEAALRRLVDYAPGHYDVALVLAQVGRPEAAREHLAESLTIDPHNAAALFAMGNAQRALGDKAAAQDYFRRALAEDTNYAEAHYALALLLLEQAQNDSAVEHLQAVVRINPQVAEAHYALAGALAQRGDYPNALQHYEAVVRLHPDDTRALNNLGVVLMNLGQTERAIQAFAAAVEKDASYLEAKSNLANARQVQAEARARP